MIRFQAFGIPFTLPALSLFAPLLCVRLGLKMNLCALMIGVGLHEFGHILAARIFRVRITEIRLLPFGGSARMENPYGVGVPQLFATSAAGPAANLLCATVFAALAQWHLIRPESASAHISVNLTLFLFNLLPALPLDGGRMLFCMLQGLFGRSAALKAGILLGRILATAFLLLAVYGYLRTRRLNLCLILVSVFIFASAGDEQSAMLEAKVSQLSKQLKETLPVRIYQLDKGTSILDCLPLLRPREAAWFLLTEDGEPSGLLNANRIADHFSQGGSQDAPVGTLPHYILPESGYKNSRTP